MWIIQYNISWDNQIWQPYCISYQSLYFHLDYLFQLYEPAFVIPMDNYNFHMYLHTFHLRMAAKLNIHLYLYYILNWICSSFIEPYIELYQSLYWTHIIYYIINNNNHYKSVRQLPKSDLAYKYTCSFQLRWCRYLGILRC